MAYHFHKDRNLYFQHQRENCKNYVIPFIREAYDIPQGGRVLEIGCGEGGVLQAFLDEGFEGVGVELSENKFQKAQANLQDSIDAGKAQVSRKNIYDADFENELGKFDLVVLKDVIEHIHDQPKLMEEMHKLLKPNGHIFFGFPPWHMPFGGHQQICRNKWLSKLPYYHLLPYPIYRWVLKTGGEQESIVESLIEIKDTGISLERFEHISKKTNYSIANKTLFLFNPIYKYKFGLKPRVQFPVLDRIPWLRNFYTTCGFYLLKTV